MPTYEYLCDACGHNYEIVQKISEDSLTTCPSCCQDSLKRVINATNFVLKGTGWYKTDYASSSSSGSSSSSSSGNNSSSSAAPSTASTTESKPKADTSSSVSANTASTSTVSK